MTNAFAVGVDMSLTATGITYSDGRCDQAGQSGLTDVDLPLTVKTLELTNLAMDLRQRIGYPQIVVIEGLDSSQRYGGVHERAYVWMRLVHLLCRAEIPVVEVMSQRLKIYATGNHMATKIQVKNAVRARWPQFEVGSGDNRSDAAVLCAIGADLLGRPLESPLGPVPTAHRRFMSKLRLPETLLAGAR